ncbi:hypothetical protein DPMN_047448 [Dreissena polymorpha]|uniref:Uncharacterized protein n=1 Tax=Dreissena polymorpha TaxID=45954 RepID=A0A9D4I1H6_DREPO|nr:hypothetical protein DPMN_047448 [Dreissena polymorpha]
MCTSKPRLTRTTIGLLPLSYSIVTPDPPVVIRVGKGPDNPDPVPRRPQPFLPKRGGLLRRTCHGDGLFKAFSQILISQSKGN